MLCLAGSGTHLLHSGHQGLAQDCNLSFDRLLEIPLWCPSYTTMCHAVLARSHTTPSSPAIRPYAHTQTTLPCGHGFDLPLFQPSQSAKPKRLRKKKPNILQTYSLAPLYGALSGTYTKGTGASQAPFLCIFAVPCSHLTSAMPHVLTAHIRKEKRFMGDKNSPVFAAYKANRLVLVAGSM